ncbi:MAG TPA: MATE family efflux transporter [Kofleriaceae bacterium]|nr:MATE family efflux transporter [Kofleriaceae bacterium]
MSAAPRPIVGPLLRLAAPNWIVMVTLAAVSMIDIFFVGKLGLDALAGVSITFPMMMLTQTMAAGGMGGGIAAAVARAHGAGNRAAVDRAAGQAVIVAVAMAALFIAVFVGLGRALYAAIGAAGPELEAALAYSDVLFYGAVIMWAFHSLSAVVRGTGNMTFPAILLILTQLIHVGLCPALVFGVGPVPALGVRGAALSAVLSFAPGVIALTAYLVSGKRAARLAVRHLRPDGATLWEILRVGVPGSANNVLTNANIVILTGLVAGHGTEAFTGFGIASRIEYIQSPLAFGLGAAILTMVGNEIGAGDHRRARRVTWIGAALTAALSGVIGMIGFAVPAWFVHQFSTDAQVTAYGVQYLRIVAPAYVCFGLGLGLWFAAQGAGRVKWPLIGSVVRVAMSSLGGWLVIHVAGAGLGGLFGLVAASFAAFGLVIAAATWAGKVV